MISPKILFIAPTMGEYGLGLFYKEAFERLGCEKAMTGAFSSRFPTLASALTDWTLYD